MQPQIPISKNYINLLIAVILGVLWAFLWAIDQLLTYLLFGGACFFLALFFYNRKIATVERKGQREEPIRRATYDRPLTKPDEPKQFGAPNDAKRTQFVVLVSLAIGLVFVFTIIFNVVRSVDNQVDDQAQLEITNSTPYTRAEDAYALSDFDSAYNYYKQTLREDAEMEEAWLGLGNTLYMQNKKDSSLLCYQKALQINPTYDIARYNVGWWHYEQKQYAQAIAYTKKFVQDQPDYTAALQLIGDSYYDQARYDSALQWYEGAYADGSRSRWLCHVLGYLNDRNNNTEKAITFYKEALQYDSSATEIYVRLGELFPGQEGEQYRYRAAQLKIEQGK